MTRRTMLWATLLAAPLAIVGGLAFANGHARGYTCPITGEQLPCEKCCPLNKIEKATEVKGFVCPQTGEVLPCEKCCPLNQGG